MQTSKMCQRRRRRRRRRMVGVWGAHASDGAYKARERSMTGYWLRAKKKENAFTRKSINEQREVYDRGKM